MDINAEIEKFGIIVIQSLKPTERKTGDELQHDILQYKQMIPKDMFSDIKNVVNKNDFFDCMNDIARYAREHNHIFTLHFETHGGDKGVYLSSGECVTWEEFYNSLIPVNEALCNNLLVVMAMCKGGAIVSYLDIHRRAPYRAFIGAFRDISPDEIAKGFAEFYNDYVNSLDAFKCIDKLNNELNPNRRTFWMMTQKEVFNECLNPNRDPAAFKKMVTKNIKVKNKSVGMLVKIVAKYMENDKKNNIDHFCFKDIYK